MFHWFGVVTNTKGDSLPGWQVECVQLSDGSTVVPIYSDENLTPILTTSGIADRAKADANGNYDFFVLEGAYSLRFYDANGNFQRLQRYLPMYGNAPEAAIDALEGAQAAQASAEAAAEQAGDFNGLIAYRSWAVLNAVIGSANDMATVLVDTGTHTDPVVGGTVSNSGIFSYSTSPAGWQRIADTSAAAAATARAAAEGYALTLEANASGGFYASLAEGVADVAVEVGEAFNVIADGRHYVARKTAADAGVIVAEYNTTGVFPELAASGGAGLVGYIATGAGAVERTVQDKLRDIPTEEDFVDGTPRGFWTDTSPTGRVWRPLDRVMIGGAAIEASGLRDPGANKGWLGYEANGFMTYFETTSQFQSWAYQGGAAIIGASRSSDLPGNAFQGVPMGVGAYVTNDLNGAVSMVWGNYAMAQRGVGVAGGAIGIETNVANRGAEVSVNPFNMAPAGLTAAAWFRTGGEVSESGLSVAAASLAVGITHDDSNPNAKFLKGIVFQSGALKPNGAGNGIAIEMAKNHEMRWIRDGSGSRSGWVRSDASTSSTGLVFVNGGAAFQNEANQTAFLVNAAASSANYLRVDSIGAGASPAIIAEGSDTNIDLTLATKGSGVLRFGYWNTNDDAPINGYIFIRDGYGNLRKLATIA